MPTDPYSPPRAHEERKRPADLGPTVRRLIWQVTWMAGGAMGATVAYFVWVSVQPPWPRQDRELKEFLVIIMIMNLAIIGYAWLLRTATPNMRILGSLMIVNFILLVEWMALVAAGISALSS